MSNKQTFAQAGYTHVSTVFANGRSTGEHLLRDADGKLEVWFANKGHASYGLVYKNTHLEFARSA